MLYYIIIQLMSSPIRTLAFTSGDPKNFSTIESGNSLPSVYRGIDTADNYAKTLNAILEWSLALAGALAFVALLWGAAQYLLAAGDEQKALVAKKTLTYAIVGIVLISLFLAILYFITGTLFQGFLPPPT